MWQSASQQMEGPVACLPFGPVLHSVVPQENGWCANLR